MLVNPSRAPSVCVKIAAPSEANRTTTTTYAIQANTQHNHLYSVFTSVLFITSADLSIDTDSSTPFRGVQGLLCTQEWERFCTFFCTIFKQPNLSAQIYENSISVTTRAKPKDSKRDTTSTFYQFHLTMPCSDICMVSRLCPHRHVDKTYFQIITF